MAPRSAWFRRRVNSGRLAEPARYAIDGPAGSSLPRHGTVAPDARLPAGGRLRESFGATPVLVAERPIEAPIPVIAVGAETVYRTERAWLVRPDGYLAGSAPLSDAPAWIGPALDRLRASGRAD
jgi:hypothetical protein